MVTRDEKLWVTAVLSNRAYVNDDILFYALDIVRRKVNRFFALARYCCDNIQDIHLVFHAESLLNQFIVDSWMDGDCAALLRVLRNDDCVFGMVDWIRHRIMTPYVRLVEETDYTTGFRL